MVDTPQDLHQSNPETSTNDQSSKSSKKYKKEKKKSVPVHQLFRFANGLDRVLILVGLLCSAATGALVPIGIIVFGKYLNVLIDSLSDPSKIVDETLPVILTLVYMGIGLFVAAYLAQCCWIITGESQTRRIRFKYLHSVLRQDMSWFDKAEEGSLTTRLSADAQLIQDGISEKFGLFTVCMAQLLSGYITALATNWKLALVILASAPAMVLSAIIMGYFVTKYTEKSQDAYAHAGSVAEQAFSGLRTVYAFSMQSRFVERYNKELFKARAYGYKRGIALGVGTGVLLFSFFGVYALAFWYGSKLVFSNTINGPTIIVVLEAIVTGSSGLMNLPPNLTAVANACGAAQNIFATIDRKSEIDSDSKEGDRLDDDMLSGNIEFRDINFVYPTRPDITILDKFNLKIKGGQKIALVGKSGSGKSTTIQLLQRFYDPGQGHVYLDNHDLRDLNVGWLREQMGVVSQEPNLFNMTIRQNIMLGTSRSVSNQELVAACKTANCHKFITQLPQGYDTLVGESASMLSGGQKQRIAIARAIIKNPRILLLDEATSALDTQSERIVQRALDAASKNRTTIMIAHRLSTIRNADMIVVMDNGKLIEQGTHKELIELGQVYADLVKKQEIASNEDESSDEINTEIETPSSDEEKMTFVVDEPKVSTAELEKVITTTSIVDPLTTSTQTAYELKIERMREDKALKISQSAPVLRVLYDMRPEWFLLSIGYIGASISGIPFPLFALLFSKVIISISIAPNTNPGPMEGPNLYAFLFMIVGLVCFFSLSAKIVCFELAGESYSRRLRFQLFKAYLKQEVGFYDQTGNSTGALTTQLSTDTKNVNEMVTKAWGEVLQITVTGIVGLVMAFVYCWQLTLVILGMAPFLLFGTFYEAKVEKGFTDNTSKAYSESGEVANEAIKGIRTVASLNQQQYFEDQFYKSTERPHLLTRRKALVSSFGYALMQSVIIFTECVAFYAGMRFIANGWIGFNEMFTSLMMVMLTAMGVGQSLVFTKTFIKAKVSAIAIFDIIDRQPAIDPDLEGAEPKNVDGDVKFQGVAFSYPSRPDTCIFNGDFNLHAKSNQTVALVGHSGNGKSTVIGMLQRWYDPQKGSVLLDDHNINSLTLGHLRSNMALVSQEPILFDLSIKENIELGVEGELSSDTLIEACKQANIYDFIKELPNGYESRVGDKGSQLSGGQKQRIAIARALVRQPKILLLDEATSALDSESEKLVQEALDNVIQQGGRTTITIAHRLSSIQNSDIICVINDGRVVEQGSHQELLKLKGLYAELVEQQSLNVS
ncbi:P-loop containing nucleoside triphosphate hydrolase protein [Halteromyces radiatus]|uniref:P-loop containing nucleoside triphosphate hydrolase protein n=1 Tax=Halteromyces radiatus TaxID=101107 RepID=UPI00222057FE|nr:P-loop containing nucleoside triphosphate hydrolase protein [Halteromyces radiatus]KAI8098769.1 P-loop containing nucleoside triphosphate hydrolase protein [Halteromyces radiatus]